LWIAFAAQPEGRVVVDAGAVSAIETRGTSLLSPGISSVEGDFSSGDVVDIIDASGQLVARGSAAMSRSELVALVGKRLADLADGASTLVVHRDEMVVLSALR
jgi:glutamate 5-kinase